MSLGEKVAVAIGLVVMGSLYVGGCMLGTYSHGEWHPLLPFMQPVYDFLGGC
jgi:hypothetical protein